MRIISNDCFSGYLYKHLNKQFNHPFFWDLIHIDDFTRLIKNFKNLNFENIEIKCDPGLKNFRIILDEKIILNKIYYIFNATDDVPRKEGVNVYSNKIWEHIYNEYMKRLSRMQDDDVIFILHNDTWCDDAKDKDYKQKVKSLITYCKENKIKLIYLTSFDIDEEDTSTFKKIFFTTNDRNLATRAARFSDSIQEFIESNHCL